MSRTNTEAQRLAVREPPMLVVRGRACPQKHQTTIQEPQHRGFASTSPTRSRIADRRGNPNTTLRRRDPRHAFFENRNLHRSPPPPSRRLAGHTLRRHVDCKTPVQKQQLQAVEKKPQMLQHRLPAKLVPNKKVNHDDSYKKVNQDSYKKVNHDSYGSIGSTSTSTTIADELQSLEWETPCGELIVEQPKTNGNEGDYEESLELAMALSRIEAVQEKSVNDSFELALRLSKDQQTEEEDEEEKMMALVMAISLAEVS